MAVTADLAKPKDAPATAHAERAPAAGDARLTGSPLPAPFSPAIAPGALKTGPSAPNVPDLLGRVPTLGARRSLVAHTQQLHGNQYAQRMIARNRGSVRQSVNGPRSGAAINGKAPASQAPPSAGLPRAPASSATTAPSNGVNAAGEFTGGLPVTATGTDERAVGIAELAPIVDQVSGSLSSSIAASFGQQIAEAERAASAAVGQVQDAAGGLTGRIEAAFTEGRSTLTTAFNRSRADVEESSLAARTEVQQSADAGYQQVETGKQESLGQVDEALGQAESRVQSRVETVRAEVQPVAGQSAVDEQAAAVAASYQGVDGGDAAQAAVEEVAGRSTAEYATQGSAATAELDGVSTEATRVWQEEGQTARQHVDDAAQVAASVIDQGRAQAEEGLTAKVDEQLGELSTGESETLTQLETSQADVARDAEANTETTLKAAAADLQTQRQGLEEARDEASAASDGANAEFSALMREYPDATADPEAVRSYFEEAAATRIQGLEEHLRGYQAESESAWQQEAENVASQTSAAGDDIIASVEAGKEATTSSLGGMVAEADAALAGAGRDAGQRLAAVGEQSTAAMATTAQQMRGGLDQGLADLSGLLGQGQATFRASSATAVGQSRSAMARAAEQATMSALDPRKLVGDLLSFIGPLWSAVAPFFQAMGDQFVWTLKQVANFYKGFVWGETAFADLWGADVIAFIGDLVAGFLVWGDIRDIIKHFGTFFIDLFSGKGIRWLALILGIVAIISLYPVAGDIFKVIVKGIMKFFVKEAAQKLAKEITERLLKVFTQAEIDRLVKELGEELVAELVEEVGEKALKELVDTFGEAGVKQLVKTFSVDGLKDLIGMFPAKDLKKLVDAFPLNTLKDLVDRFLVKGLKELVDKIGVQLLKDLVDRLLDALQPLVEKFTAAGLKTLLDTFTVQELKDIVDGFGARGLKELVDAFSAKGVKELVGTFKVDGLQKLVVAFPLDKLKELVQKVLLKDLKTLMDEVDAQGLKNLVDGLGMDALGKLIQELGADVIARLVRGMDASTFHTVSFIDSIPRVGGIDDFVALVRRDGPDAMIKYGADALQKVGKADLETFAGIVAATISPEKLKKKWKHAKDFGIPGTFKDKDLVAHQQFRDALNKVVANPDFVYVGPYSDFPHAAHFFQGDLIVIVELAGDFISGWGNAGNKLAGIRVTAPPKVGAKNFRVR